MLSCRVDDIPFLPVSFFKNHKVISGFIPGILFLKAVVQAER